MVKVLKINIYSTKKKKIRFSLRMLYKIQITNASIIDFSENKHYYNTISL